MEPEVKLCERCKKHTWHYGIFLTEFQECEACGPARIKTISWTIAQILWISSMLIIVHGISGCSSIKKKKKSPTFNLKSYEVQPSFRPANINDSARRIGK